MKSSCSRISFRHSPFLALFVFLLALFISFGGSAVYADTFVVDTTSDDGPGSLRAAIANADSYYDVISFNVTGTITLSSQLEIKNGLTIKGPGADLLAISGNNVCRVFYIETAESVDISGISIVSGNAIDGGGMLNESSHPTVTNCTFSSSSGFYYGGGMYNRDSSPTVTNCIFSLNSATIGGGMYNESYSSPTVTNCTFSTNSATTGGGMYNYNGSSPTVTNCTFSANSATTGGGMHNYSHSNPKVTNCIFWDESDEIYNKSSAPTLSYCIVRNDDVGDGTNFNNIISQDPKLGSLADNGGPTWTCALGAGSPAIDAGTYVEGLDADQRDVPRPFGYEFDIGAYEVDVASYTINAYCTFGGIITPDSTAVFEGASMDITISSDLYYHIDGLYVDGEPVSYNEAENTYTFDNVSSDHVIMAFFALDEYDLTVSVNGTGTGTVEVSPDLATYPHGTEVEVTAVPGTGSDFASWQGALSGDINPQTLTMNEVKEVAAIFNTKTFVITLDAGNHGDITGSTSVTWNSTPTYTIDCDTGYAISDVRLDGISQGAVSSITLDPVTDDHSLTVTFSLSRVMVSEAGLADFAITSPPSLNSELLASLDLPGGTTSEDLDLVSEDLVQGMEINGVTVSGVDSLLESREEGETFIKGASFDIAYDNSGIATGVLPIYLELEISRIEIGEEYSSLIDEESSDKGLRTAFLDHVGILKVISPDIYDLLEEAWEDYPEEEAKEFFEVSADIDNYYVGMNLLVADKGADSSEMTVQAISDETDRYFFIFDGEEDGHFKDPIAAVRKPLAGSGGGGGGCRISVLPVISLLLMIPLALLFRKRK